MVCFGAGLSPDEFWDSTIDEVILTYKGKVMDWGVYRVGVLLTVAPHVKEGVNLNSLFKLPFDDESQDEMTEEEMMEAYKKAKEVTETWLKKKNG